MTFDTLDLAHLPRKLGISRSRPSCFDGTVWSNIRYGLADATNEEVEARRPMIGVARDRPAAAMAGQPSW